MCGSVNANDDLVQVRWPAPHDEDGAPCAANNPPRNASHEQTVHHPMTTPAQQRWRQPRNAGPHGARRRPVSCRQRRRRRPTSVGIAPVGRPRPRTQHSGRAPPAGWIAGTLRESCERRRPERAFGRATGSPRPWRWRALPVPSRRSPLRYGIPSWSRDTSLARRLSPRPRQRTNDAIGHGPACNQRRWPWGLVRTPREICPRLAG